nr:hypothetical protein [Bradyrhizobium sp.]
MPTGFHAASTPPFHITPKAVKAAGTAEAGTVMKQMEKERVHDLFAGDGYIRADRKMIHDMYPLQVKKPGDAKGEWDLYNLLQTLPGATVSRPLAESSCPLMKK